MSQQTPHHRCAFALIAKAPMPGLEQEQPRVPPLTPVEAIELKKCFLRDIAANIGVIVDDGRADGIVLFTPTQGESIIRELVPKNFKLFPQRGSTPGEVLINAMEDLISRGFPSVCLINTDSPAVSRPVFEVALQSLSRPGDRLVLGTLDRGGFYLIGLKQAHRDLFDRISLSTVNFGAHASARAAGIGLKVEMLPPWYEVKDARGLNRLCRDLLGPDSRERARSAPYTCKYLARLVDAFGAERISPDLARQS